MVGRKVLFLQFYRQRIFCEHKLSLQLVFLLKNSSTSALTAPGQEKDNFPFQTLTKVAAAPINGIQETLYECKLAFQVHFKFFSCSGSKFQI